MVKINQITKPSASRFWVWIFALVAVGVFMYVKPFPTFKKIFFSDKQPVISMAPMPVLYALPEFEFTDFNGNITQLEIFIETEHSEQLSDINKEESKINAAIIHFFRNPDAVESNTKILQTQLLNAINQAIAPLQIKKIYLNRFNP